MEPNRLAEQMLPLEARLEPGTGIFPVPGPVLGEWDDAQVPPGGLSYKLQGSESRVVSSGEWCVHTQRNSITC